MKALLFAISLLCSLSSFTTYPELQAPYNTVNVLPFNPQGWYQNAPTMEWLIRSRNVKVVIEVGSWLGSSTRHIAKTLPEDGVVYAVDHWMGSANEDNSSFDIPNLYRQFLSNVIHENLTHKIIPIKMPSASAARLLDAIPDLVYIDATHEFASVLCDLALWYPFVEGHGVLCGDDYFWADDPSQGGGPVKRAVDTFARDNNLIVHNDGWMWFLEEL